MIFPRFAAVSEAGGRLITGGKLFWWRVPRVMAVVRVTGVGPDSIAPTTRIGPRPMRVVSERQVETFDEYYRRDYRKLVGLAYVLCGSQWAAEDLAHEALTEAHRRWTKVSNYDDPAAWVRRVMVNKNTSRFRKLRSEAKALVRLGNHPVETIAPSEASNEVWTAVRSLPSRQAQTIALFYWEDRSIADIADILGCGTETVKTHLARARRSLAVTLGGEFEGVR